MLGCVAAPSGANFQQQVPKLTGLDDPLLKTIETLVRVSELRSRKERAAVLIERLQTVDGAGAVPLLLSLQKRTLLAARDDLDLDLGASWMVGDQRRDVAAGRAAGCRTVRIGDPLDAAPEPEGPDIVAVDVPTAARLILASGGA